MARLAGSISLGVGPSVQGFWKEFNAKLKSEKAPDLQVRVSPETAKASAELAAWRKRQELNALNIRVKTDEPSFKRAEQSLKRLETTYSKSKLSKAIRIQIVVAGATALPALAQGALSAASALTDLARSALVLPGIFSGLAATVATLLTGISGLSAAFKASNDGVQKGAQFTREYQRASRDLEKAQRDVVQALKDANREIQDQHDKLTQGTLSLEQAQINVRRANERLAKGGFDSMSDWQQAVLDVKQANFDLGQTIKQTGRDTQDYYDNAKKSATQTDTFKDAIDHLADSTDAFTKAQRQANGVSDQFFNAMKNLSPAAQDFVNKVLSIKDAWKGLQNAVSDKLLSGLGDQIVDLANKRLPALQQGMSKIAGSLNTTFKSILQNIGSDANADRFSKIFDRTARAITLMQPGINAFVNAFIHLSEVGSRFLPRLGNAFSTIGTKFEAFINRADADGSLENWINRGLNLLTSLGRSIGYIGDILGSVQKAYEKATGNVGGFATTLESSLGKLAAYLGSDKGQGALIGYIHQAQLFLDTIKKNMPGIIDAFQTFSDGARAFATAVFPLFSGIGRFLREHVGIMKILVPLYFGLKTAAPIISSLEKAWRRAASGIAAYKLSLREARDAQRQLTLSAKDAEGDYRAARVDRSAARDRKAEAERLQAKAQIDQSRTLSENKLARDRADREVESRRTALNIAKQEQLAAQAAFSLDKQHFSLIAEHSNAIGEAQVNQRRLRREIAADKAYLDNPDTLLDENPKTVKSRIAAKKVEIQESIDLEENLQSERQRSFEQYTSSLNHTAETEENVAKKSAALQEGERNRREVSRQTSTNETKAKDGLVAADGRVVTAERELQAANSTTVQKMNAVVTATSKVEEGNKRLSGSAGGGFGRLRTVIGQRGGGGGVLGVLGALGTAFGGVLTAIGGVAAGAGLIYALDQLAQAHQRSEAAADAQRQSEESLANTLDKGTGAATRATLEENVRQLRTSVDPNAPDDNNRRFDATKILQNQLGLTPQQQAALALPTQVTQLNQQFAKSDQQIVGAVQQLDDWKKFGDKFKAGGVDEHTYGLALNGDRDAIAKVEAVRNKLFEDQKVLGLSLPKEVAAKSGVIPEDLANVRENQLGAVNPGLRDLSKAIDATRGVSNRSVDAGQGQQADAAAIPGSGTGKGGLKTNAFDAFVPNFTAVQADGSISISTDKYPDDVVKGWIEGARDNGIDVERRFPAGATIHIDAEHAKKYIPGLASGGHVWGSGSATSDSIPAMLSNGEFVVNAKSAKAIGSDNLRAMNSGGSVWPWAKMAIGGLAGTPLKPKPFYPITPGGIADFSANLKPVLPNVSGTVSAPGAAQPTGLSRLGHGISSFGSWFNANLASPDPNFKTNDTNAVPTRRTGVQFPRTTLDALKGPWSSPSTPFLGAYRDSLAPPGFKAPAPLASKPAAPKTVSVITPDGKTIQAEKSIADAMIAGGTWRPAGGTGPHGGHGGAAGPDGAPSAPGVPGNAVTPTPVAPPAAQPGQVPTYEQLGANTGSGFGDGTPFVPDLSGTGALPEIITAQHNTAASAAPNAPIIPNANILQYLTQLAGTNDLKIGSGSDTNHGGTHSPDGAQHSVNRALDIGSLEQAQGGQISEFVKKWIADPTKVASTRQLIFRGPDGDYGIINGRVLTGPELQSVYGKDLGDHTDHVHLALEGVPADAVGDGSSSYIPSPTPGDPSGAPPNSIAASAPNPFQNILGNIFGINNTGGGGTGAPAAVPGFNTPIQGPFGPIPFNGQEILQTIGQTFLQAILGFFGINISPITDVINKITGAAGAVGQPNTGDIPVPGDPGPDQTIVQQLIDQATQAKADGNEPLARSLLNSAQQYQSRGASGSGVPTIAAGPLSAQSGQADVAKAIIARAQAEGYSPEQTQAILSAGLQESGLNPTSSGGGGAWHGIFQQDGGYPGRDDPNQNIDGFFSRLRSKGGPSGDIWKNIFWLQQRPGDPTADAAFANGRPGYLTEIQSKLANAQNLYHQITGYARGGAVGRGIGLPQPGGWHRAQFNPGMKIDLSNIGTSLGPVAAALQGMPLSTGAVGDHKRGPEHPIDYTDWQGYLEDISSSPGALNDGPNFRGGGPISGSGSSTSDSIPAMLSNGEFVMNAAATQRIGRHRLNKMNHLAAGGGVGLSLPWLTKPTQAPGPLDLNHPSPAAPAPGIGSALGQQAAPIGQQGAPGGWLQQAAPAIGSAAGSVLTPKGSGAGGWGAGSGSGWGPGPQGGAPAGSGRNQPDPRSIPGAPPVSNNHLNPALKEGIEGAFSTAGSIAATAASLGADAAAPGSGGAVGAGIQAGAQMAGQIASGIANIGASLGVGTITAGQGYGAPLLPSLPQAPQSQAAFTSIHNGDIYSSHPEEAFRLRDRKDHQKTLSLMNRVP